MLNEYEEYFMNDNLYINWYLGYMKKIKELVKNNLKLIDVVIEFLDVRILFSSKNLDIDRFVGDKLRVVVFNKSDMVDRDKLN